MFDQQDLPSPFLFLSQKNTTCRPDTRLNGLIRVFPVLAVGCETVRFIPLCDLSENKKLRHSSEGDQTSLV